MRVPNWLSRKSWKPGDRVVVATGRHGGKRGKVTARTTAGNYLVLFDGDKKATEISKGVLDRDRK